MARDIEIARVINIRVIKGLSAPRCAPDDHPLFWHEQDIGKVPPVIRWAWHPPTGDLHIGAVIRHVLLIPRDHRPFESYLRGFVFRYPTCVALRPYFWPEHRFDQWDEAHALLNDRVADVFLHLIKPDLPERTRVFRNIDNPWLRQSYPNISLLW